jgi:hypothetical protein
LKLQVTELNIKYCLTPLPVTRLGRGRTRTLYVSDRRRRRRLSNGPWGPT